MKRIALFSLLCCLLWTSVASAHNPVGIDGKKRESNKTEQLNSRMDCLPGEGNIDQDINNVRARLLTSGDVWWNLDVGRYIVPKPAPGEIEVSSIFAGGVWIGGTDPNGSLKLAGVTYRTTGGTDFYPGPLDTAGATIQGVCQDWDRFFVVESDEIAAHNTAWEAARASGREYNCDSIPDRVLSWPGRGNPYWSQFYEFDLPDQPLGNFWDQPIPGEDFGDGIYDPCDGDFPVIFIEGCPNGIDALTIEEPRQKNKELVPDQMIYWIYNDNGGPHNLSLATAIQMEVQVQAFAYATNDELNDMTFQRYRLINKAETDIRNCYFGMWVDPDLGCSDDDFIGCDPERELMYVYNEDNVDGITGCDCPVGGEQTPTYCTDIPMIGIDYFRGPTAPKIFGEDGELIDPPIGSGEVDTIVELGMTSFIYFNRIDQVRGDPQIGEEFYNYLTGLWRDGTPFTFGGTGYNPGSTDTTAFVFPNAPNDPNGWSMVTADLPFDDRRTVQATGPLLLQPSAINELIIGLPWVPNVDHPAPDLEPLLAADELAQNLFDNCFDIVDGPDAPDMTGLELDRELILVLTNDTVSSNNKFLAYAEVDIKSTDVDTTSSEQGDSLYRFEGYKVFQLADANVSVGELDDPSRARQVAQVDVANGVTEIFNWSGQPNPDATLPTVFSPSLEVAGADEGVRTTFQVLSDAFAQGVDTRLINHKRYHYTVVAYAYNNFKSFDQTDRTGQRQPYLEGRRNIETYTFVPRPIVYDSLSADYGFGPIVTRVSGQGSGGANLMVSREELDALASNPGSQDVTYAVGGAPIDVKIFDPFSIENGQYRLEIFGEQNEDICAFDPEGARWVLRNIETEEEFVSETDLSVLNEQIIYGKGFSVTVNHVESPTAGLDLDAEENAPEPSVANNGAVAQSISYEDPTDTLAWFDRVPEFFGAFGDYVIDPNSTEPLAADPNGDFNDFGANAFFPWYHVSNFTEDGLLVSPGPISLRLPRFQREEFPTARRDILRLSDLNNVDIVFTSNKDLWSRCIVVEGANDRILGDVPTQGNREQFQLRGAASVDKNGQPDGDGESMSWFPGYAVDVETGKRLNLFFAENSASPQDIGRDMLWNPSSTLFLNDEIPQGAVNNDNLIVGGNHYIYVTSLAYDECAAIREELTDADSRRDFSAVTSKITWTTFPRLAEGSELLSVEQGLIPNDLIVSLRVTNPFGEETTQSLEDPDDCFSVEGNPIYEFNFDNVAPRDLQPDQFDNALSNVRVVPNPYYAYSSYENSSFANTVKVTNLPAKAIVTIYTLDGKFIRQFNRDEAPQSTMGNNPARTQGQIFPDLEWDLNNFAGVPVASGVYIFHVQAPDLGVETSIKWFGVKRRFDPTGI